MTFKERLRQRPVIAAGLFLLGNLTGAALPPSLIEPLAAWLLAL